MVEGRQWGNYDLTYEQFKLFLSMSRNPAMNYHKLSQDSGISSYKIQQHVDHFKKLGFLRKDKIIDDPILGPRLQTEVEGLYNPETIGLKRIHVIFSRISTLQTLSCLLSLVNKHPYIHYSGPIYSKNINLYVQFDIPKDATSQLQAYLKILKEADLFKTFSLTKPTLLANSELNLIRWALFENELMEKENYSLRHNTNGVPLLTSMMGDIWDSFQNSVSGLNQKLETAKPKSGQIRFDKFDLQLLRELTINSKLHIKTILPEYNVDRTTISKRLKRIRSTVISRDLLYFDHNRFNITTNLLISGRFNDKMHIDVNHFSKFINSNDLFLSSDFVGDKLNFLWTIRLSTSFIPEIVGFISPLCERINVFHIQNRLSHINYLNVSNYLEKGRWRADREYMVENPINEQNFVQFKK